jgi:hypothetical protein
VNQFPRRNYVALPSAQFGKPDQLLNVISYRDVGRSRGRKQVKDFLNDNSPVKIRLNGVQDKVAENRFILPSREFRPVVRVVPLRFEKEVVDIMALTTPIV